MKDSITKTYISTKTAEIFLNWLKVSLKLKKYKTKINITKTEIDKILTLSFSSRDTY
jgi:hypothetical protein